MQDRQNVIDISRLHYRWREGLPLVLDIDELRIQRGERVFIKGASGSGKSTVLSLMAGVLTPEQGQLTILGQELMPMKGAQRDAFRADHIGFIFQMFNLLPYLSVIDNVTLPLHFSARRRNKLKQPRQEAERLLAHLDLIGPDILSRAVSELSVGQQQRVAAARALIGSPEILIADEPTSALDTDRREAFIKLLLSESDACDTTLVFVSHDDSLRRYFDRSINLGDINLATSQGE